ncbi:MAG: C-GCAxxG-C-C family protein [Chloroflexi bacterium]|nr:C-GCAxxG-C-C family protein [Chloroflexota bacterium]
MLLSLQEEFGLGDLASFKAATVLAGGVARQGETCGALLGALMALGLAIGRERMEDTQPYRRAMGQAQEVARRFRQELQTQFGFTIPLESTLCREIQARVYGRSFNTNIPGEYEAFLAAGGHSAHGCPKVCAVAAQAAARELLHWEQHRPAP